MWYTLCYLGPEAVNDLQETVYCGFSVERSRPTTSKNKVESTRRKKKEKTINCQGDFMMDSPFSLET